MKEPYNLFINEEKISEMTVSVNFEYFTEKDYTWEFYMRRGNSFYFRSSFYGKIKIELDYFPEELSSMKYGTKVDITWDDN